VIIERSAAAADGYAVGLYPLGSCVLHGLGSYSELMARSLVAGRYELALAQAGYCSRWTRRSLPARAGRC
jgi:hypothetical protein